MRLFDRLLAPNINKLESHGNVETLAKVLESDDRRDLRLAAIGALSRIGGPRTLGPLVTALSNDDSEVTLAAEKALTEMGTAPGAALVGALPGRGGDAALNILINLGEDAVEFLADACRGQDDGARRRALEGLVELGTRLDNDEVREKLFRALLAALGDRLPQNRVFAAEQLTAFGDARAGRGLAAQLKDGDDSVRAACRLALQAIGESAVPHLLDALGDRNANSRRVAAELLGEVCRGDVAIDSRRIALSALTDRASDSNAEIAAAVQKAIECIPSEEVINAQLELLADPDRSDLEDVREFLDQMLAHGALRPEFEARVSERMKALELLSAQITP